MRTVLAAIVLFALSAAGCSQTRYTTSSTNQADNLSGQDWNTFAREIASSLAASGVSARYTDPEARHPPVIVIGDFRNQTSKAAFTRQKDFMYNAIQTALVNSGQFAINMDIAGRGGDVETMIRDARRLRGSDEYDQGTVARRGTLQAPDLILTGEIGEIISRSGRTTQYDYQVDLTLLDVETGLTAGWRATIPLSKTFTRGLIGG